MLNIHVIIATFNILFTKQLPNSLHFADWSPRSLSSRQMFAKQSQSPFHRQHFIILRHICRQTFGDILVANNSPTCQYWSAYGEFPFYCSPTVTLHHANCATEHSCKCSIQYPIWNTRKARIDFSSNPRPTAATHSVRLFSHNLNLSSSNLQTFQRNVLYPDIMVHINVTGNKLLKKSRA